MFEEMFEELFTGVIILAGCLLVVIAILMGIDHLFGLSLADAAIGWLQETFESIGA